MAITSALVLLAVCWFMTLFVVLPFVTRTQGEEGKVEPGTHASAPSNFKPRKTAIMVTLIAVPIWAVITTVIISGVVDVRKFNWMDELPANTPPTPK